MNFVDCHEEKIHISGHIQDFGYLLGLDIKTRSVQFFSRNIADLFPIDESFFGREITGLPEIFSALLASRAFTGLDLQNLQEAEVFLNKIEIAGAVYHFSLYRLGKELYLEFEPVLEAFTQRTYISTKYERIHSAPTAEKIWEELLSSVAEAIDYDRVMVYRFLEDGSGKVIAEKLKNKVESYINLHYPESDIPRQARELYLKKKKRIFSNVQATPVPVLSNSAAPTDLTFSSVRAMSPVHAQYLKNSGASSSFSTSIIINNQLWGLVTCQNTEPKHIDLLNRVRAEIFTILAANAYSARRAWEMLMTSAELDRNILDLKNKLRRSDVFEESLYRNIAELQKYPDADGLAIVVNDTIQTSGAVPPIEEIQKIAQSAREMPLQNFYSTHDFSNSPHAHIGAVENAAGLMFGFIDDQRNELLIWFRREIDTEVLWAGNPSKNVETQVRDGQSQLVISPRKSFEIYIENIKGKSRPWKERDITAAKKVVAALLEITYSQFKKVRELNQELQDLNDELDSFSYTISHDLGTPLTVMKLNAQLLEKSSGDNPRLKKQVSSILNEISGMEQMMRGVLNLSRAKSAELVMSRVPTQKIIEKICADARLTLNEDAEIVLGNCPDVLADEVMLTQVFLNIIGNAVKYSAKSGQPKVVIHGETRGEEVHYSVRDNGIGIPEEARENMFKIFNRMENAKPFQGSGVGLSIVHRIMQRLGGEISYESRVGEGTTFTIIFKNPCRTA